MYYRTALAAIVLTYLICVLILNGVQKEDIDINTLRKFQQHNINVEDLNNETVRKNCIDLQTSKMVDSIVSKLETTVVNNRKLASNLMAVKNNKTMTNPKILSPPEVNLITEPSLKKDCKEKNVTASPNTDYYQSVTETNQENPKRRMTFWEMLQNLHVGKEQQQDIPNKKQTEIVHTTQFAPKEHTAENIINNNGNYDFIRRMGGFNNMLLQEYIYNLNKPTTDIDTTTLTTDVNKYKSMEALKQVTDYFANEPTLEKKTAHLQDQLPRATIIKTNVIESNIDNLKTDNFNDLLNYVKTSMIRPVNDKIDKEKKCCVVNNNLYTINGLKHMVNNEENVTRSIPSNIIQEITDQVRKSILNDLKKESSTTNKVERQTKSPVESISLDAIQQISKAVRDSIMKDVIKDIPQRVNHQNNPINSETIVNTNYPNEIMESKVETPPQTYKMPRLPRIPQQVLPPRDKNSFFNGFDNIERKKGQYTEQLEIEATRDDKERASKSYNGNIINNYPMRNVPEIVFPQTQRRFMDNNNIQFRGANILNFLNQNAQLINITRDNGRNYGPQFMKPPIQTYPYNYGNMARGINNMPEIIQNYKFQDLPFQIAPLDKAFQNGPGPLLMNYPYNNVNNNAGPREININWPKIQQFTMKPTVPAYTTTTEIGMFHLLHLYLLPQYRPAQAQSKFERSPKFEKSTPNSENLKVLDQLKVLFQELDSIKQKMAPSQAQPKVSNNDGTLQDRKPSKHQEVILPNNNNINSYSSMKDPYVNLEKTFLSVPRTKHTSPLMIQTNRESIPPLGIPIMIKKSPFDVMLVNQNIIVTSTKKPFDNKIMVPFEINSRKRVYKPRANNFNGDYDDIDKHLESYYEVHRKQPLNVMQKPRSRDKNYNNQPDSDIYRGPDSMQSQSYPIRRNPAWNEEKYNAPSNMRSNPELNSDNYASDPVRGTGQLNAMDNYEYKLMESRRKPYPEYETENSGRTNQLELETYNLMQSKLRELPQFMDKMTEQYGSNSYQKLPEIRLERDRKLVGPDLDVSSATGAKVPQRQQLPLKKQPSKYDDTHFKNFLKTQQKVNAMLERILATKVPSALIL